MFFSNKSILIVFIGTSLLLLLCIGYSTRSSSRTSDSRCTHATDPIGCRTDIIAKDPNNAQAYLSRGDAKLGYSNYDTSKTEDMIVDYNHAIKLDPHLATAYYARGKAYSMLDKTDQALSDYHKTIELDSGHQAAYFSILSLLAITEENKSIILQYYDKLIGLNPSNPEPYSRQGDVYKTLGDYEQAISKYSKAIAIDPLFISPYHQRGTVYSHINNYTGAIIDYSTAIEISQHGDFSMYERGTKFTGTRLSMGDILYNLRGDLWQKLGRYEKALADYDQAIMIEEQSRGTAAWLYYKKGDIYSHLGDSQKALSHYNKACRLSNDLCKR